MASAEKKLLRALAAEDRRRDNANAGPAQTLDTGDDFIADVLQDSGVLDGSFPQPLKAGFELRLDQGGEPSLLVGKRQNMRQNILQGNKAHVADDRLRRYEEEPSIELPCVQSFMDDHPVVGAKARVELTAPAVDGVNDARAARDENIGEAAGRGADIETDEALRIELERFERRRELDAAARGPGMRRFGFDRSIGVNHRRGF